MSEPLNLPDRINLFNIANGAAEERFQRELQRVLTNVMDPNTSDKQKRKITMEFVFAPSKDRSSTDVSLKMSTKLAAAEPVESTMYIGSKDGKLLAFPRNIRQQDLFEAPKTGPDGLDIKRPM